jgi:hypothetical protein
MQIAAAAPGSGWSDLAEWLVPNGSTLDYVAQAHYFGPQHRIGVLKQAWFQTLFALGQTVGFYAPPGTDPDADVFNWNDVLNAGGPYDGNPVAEDFVDELTSHHSAYYIPDTVAPAAMLLSNGWNDDLAPVDESVRLYNKVRTDYPQAPITLFDADIGHAGRAQNKAADMAQLEARQSAWLDYYVKGVGTEPQNPVGGVDVMTTTCPVESTSAGPFHAANWAQLAPGEIRLHHPGAKTIAATGTQFGDIFGSVLSGSPCVTSPAADNPATANYELGPALAPGFTIAGSPTVIANFTVTGANDQVAARLLDVDPATETQRLLARGLWRPEVSSEAVRQVFQLHPQAYKVEPGHVVKLELLPNDSPYGSANPTSPDEAAQHPIIVTNLMLRLPVLEQPCALGGLVKDPAPKFLPQGYQLSIDVSPDPSETEC